MVVQLETLFGNFLGVTEEDHKQPQPGQPTFEEVNVINSVALVRERSIPTE
jgi:hypothetical protein